eukprot:1691480-Rhodomonas_salina.2
MCSYGPRRCTCKPAGIPPQSCSRRPPPSSDRFKSTPSHVQIEVALELADVNGGDAVLQIILHLFWRRLIRDNGGIT